MLSFTSITMHPYPTLALALALSPTNPKQVLSLTSITMHALNVVFMLAEFALNGLLVEAWHFGLIVAWASLYGLFNGLQAIRR